MRVILCVILAAQLSLASCDINTCKSKHLNQKMLDSVDLCVDPCQDFYEYSCARWKEENPIPDDQSRWLGFYKIDEAVKYQMKDVLSEQVSEVDSHEKRWAKTYFTRCLDPADSFAQGFGAQDLVKMVSDWPLLDENATRHMKAYGANQITMYDEEALRTFQESAFFPFEPTVNDSDNSRNIIHFYETPLSLPTAKYLDEKYEKDQGFIKTFIKKSALLLARDGGLLAPNDQDKQIEELFQFEKEIAKIYPTEVARNDISNRRNIKTIDQLHQLIDGDERDEYEKNSTGKDAATPYWKYCLKQTEKFFFEGVSAVYVDRFVPIGTKDKIEQMSDDMKKIYLKRMDELDWMDDETREYAKFKLKKMKYHYIINPKLNMSREGVSYKQVLSDDQIQSLFKMNLELYRVVNQNDGLTLFRKVELADNLNILSATVANAFYYAEFNTIVIPGAILQAPFYDINGTKEVNIAGIGSIIGHEMAHAFDDTGSKFAENGTFYNWWSNESAAAFKERTECLISQYSAYEVPEINITLNGNLTVGENIADNGAVRVGYQETPGAISESRTNVFLGICEDMV